MARQRLPKKRSTDWQVCASACYSIRSTIQRAASSANALKVLIAAEETNCVWVQKKDVNALLDTFRACYAEAHEALKGTGRAG